MIPITGGPSIELINGWRWEKQFGTRVNSDGTLVVYAGYNKGVPVGTVIRDLRSGDESELKEALDDPQWLPDSKQILGTKLSAGSHPEGEILICPVDRNACRKVATGYNPVPSRDGTWVYYLRSVETADGADLWSVSLDDLVKTRLARFQPMNPIAHFYDVSQSGEIVWVQFKPGREELWLWDWSVDQVTETSRRAF
jgi:hypothetical protein